MTRELFNHGTLDERGSVRRLALFSGPHGVSIPVGENETILMVGTGFGIAAQLPYLRKLIHGYNTCKARRRRGHLVWQLQSLGKLLMERCITRADEPRHPAWQRSPY